MSVHENEGPFTLNAGEAMSADRLVLLSSGDAMYADAGEEPIGLNDAAVGHDEQAVIKPLRGGVMKVTASKVIASGAALYVAADGMVSDAAVGKQIGIAFSAATGAGGKISAIMWGPRGGSDLLTARGGNIEFFDDFFVYGTGNWTTVEDATATTGDVITDANGGVVNIGPDGDADDECYVSSVNEIFKFQTNKKMLFETRVKVTEGNTDDANIIIGLSDTVGANSLVDSSAGPMASFIGACFYKIKDSLLWRAITSNGAVQAADTNVGVMVSGSWVKLSIFYDYNDGTTANVYFYVDGVLGATLTLTIAAVAEMHILFGVKQGGTSTEESLLVDYVHVIAER